MRVCTKCGIEKSESEYFFKDRPRGRLHSQCKVCYKIQRAGTYKAHYNRNLEQYRERARRQHRILRQTYRAFMLEYMADKKCVICGESDMRVFEFDHIDPSKKKFNISQGIHKGFNMKAIMLELTKCRILCANCHKRHTAQQFGWYKAI